MTADLRAIDCDVHPTVPDIKALLPYLDDHWRDAVEDRGIPSLELISYPPNAPLTARPDWRRKNGRAATDGVAAHRASVRPLAGGHRDLQLSLRRGSAVQRGHGGGLHARAQRLDRQGMARPRSAAARLDRACRCRTPNMPWMRSSVAPRTSASSRILVLAMQETPLGRRHLWPIYAAAERHGLPLGIHAGSSYRHSITSLGWPSYYIEDYASHTQAFQSQVASLVCEGRVRQVSRI